MPYSAEHRITTLEIRKQATPKQLADELTEAILAASSMGVFTRMENCHNTRRCLWAGQTEDGRRGTADENERMFRWKGAPDLRVPLADTQIRRLMLIRSSVTNRGDVTVAPRRVDEAQSQNENLAGSWQQVMQYFLDIIGPSLFSSLDLFNTCTEELGYCGLLPDWKKVRRMELKKMNLQQIADALIESQTQMMATDAETANVDPEIYITPEIQQAIADRVGVVLDEMLGMDTAPTADHIALVRAVDPAMSDSEARRVIKELKKTTGSEVDYQAPRDDGGEPEVKVLVPFVNFIHPHDMTAKGETDWFCLPEYLTETDVEIRAKSENWNPKAKKNLIETQKNKLFHMLYTGTTTGSGGRLQGWLANGVGVGLEPSEAALNKCPRWLVIYQFRRVVDRNGLPRIIKCAFHPAMQGDDDLLMWQETDHDKMPLIIDTAEPAAYALLSRGVCDIVVDKQNFIKDSLDSEGARGQLGSNPPLIRGAKDHVGIKPGKELFARRSGNSFEGSEFMPVPVVDQGTFAMQDRVERLINRYYFDSEDTPIEARRMFHEWVTFKGIRVYRQLLRAIWRGVSENIEELQVSSIAGRTVRLSVTRDQLKGEVDIQIGVHLDGYGEDSADKFVGVLGKMIQMNRAENIDWSEAMRISANMLTPTYANRLVLPADVAAGRTIDDQETRLAKIMAGVPVRYDDQVSNPKLRMQVLESWAAMPGNVQRAMQDPTIAEMIRKEQEMLQFRDEQQTVNPMTGRTGVKPNTPENVAA
jgi:hypothetical protein